MATRRMVPVPVTAVLDLIAELRSMVVAAAAARPDGKLTEREHGRCDVIETVESRLEDIAAAMSDETTPRPTSGAW